MHLDRRRYWQDKLIRLVVTTGGIFVLAAMLLIFYFLLRESLPVLSPARMEVIDSYQTPVQGDAYALKMDRRGQSIFRFDQQGIGLYQIALSGEGLEPSWPLKSDSITSFANESPDQPVYAFGFADGSAQMYQTSYFTRFADGEGYSRGLVEQPFGSEPVQVTPRGEAVTHLAVGVDGHHLRLFGRSSTGLGWLVLGDGEHNNLTEETHWSYRRVPIPALPEQVDQVAFSENLEYLLIRSASTLSVVDIRDPLMMRLSQQIQLDSQDGPVERGFVLAGGNSFLFSHNNGKISQWFFVRHDGNMQLQRIRGFEADFDIEGIAVEPYRRSFMAFSGQGDIALFHATSGQSLLSTRVDAKLRDVVFSDNAEQALLISDEQVFRMKVDNPHPELNLKTLWGEVWYEHYPEPDHVWQTSAMNSDYEVKFSLTPLTLGTLKAAFFTMLFAAPLALGAAIYTAYYMPEPIRRVVKPSIEMMEALPTVILGFLAGVWLAPMIDRHLLGVLMLLAATPLLMLLIGGLSAGFISLMGRQFRVRWSWLVLVPLLALCYWGVLQVSVLLENRWFDGDLRLFLSHHYGLDIEQRSALVVGVAMGFAVIPGIFSLAEDAIHGVPRELATGSYALGANRWQTLTRVVLQMASPGIYAALMIGLGRAIGETMILLMVTGNTPLMDWSIFTSMRTVAANIAIEMPETEVGSSHYRVLFLAALLLFLLTFIVNTLAETIRQKLRSRYHAG